HAEAGRPRDALESGPADRRALPAARGVRSGGENGSVPSRPVGAHLAAGQRRSARLRGLAVEEDGLLIPIRPPSPQTPLPRSGGEGLSGQSVTLPRSGGEGLSGQSVTHSPTHARTYRRWVGDRLTLLPSAHGFAGLLLPALWPVLAKS